MSQPGSAPPDWKQDGDAISREFTTGGWPVTLMLVNAIGFVAEAADHHPDLQVSWGKVVVRLSTHSAGGVTDKDLALAREIDRVALWKPAEGGPLTGTRSKFVRGA
ncbi:MAG: 4a-hydroxytetrahydrobiopterin dehydratase [Gemmatimonadaceae bacterium]